MLPLPVRSDIVTVEPQNKQKSRKLAVYTLGFLQVPYIRRMLKIAGWDVCFGPFCRDAAAVGVWGRKPLAKRGFAAAKRRDLPVVSIEDAFLRSNHPGPATAPCGLIVDESGIYFDASKPSRLENILNGDGLDDPLLLQRALNGIAFLKANGLSKYNPVPRNYGQMPDAGYVLVVDQTAGDASIKSGNASAETFQKMLAAARAENPDKPIVIRSHPAVKSVRKSGHFTAADCDENTVLQTCRINPWDLLEGADAVYCVTSQLGFEAILAGHTPRVFGMPFYAGWGLTQDEQHLKRRVKTLTVEQLFAGAMLEYPVWIDGFQGRQCSFEEAAQLCQAKAKMAWMALSKSVALGMSHWKTPQISNFLGYDNAKPEFAKSHKNAMQQAAATGARIVVWASKLTPKIEAEFDVANQPYWRMEDGFLRSAGLGAELTPADSMVLDDLGIYYDATRASRLEQLIAASADLPDYALQRANALQQQIVEAGVTKYNLSGDAIKIPASDKTVILVPGQVEDDASIRFGTTGIKTNSGLLAATRAANPDAYILYKPHPDVLAGLRPGQVQNPLKFADLLVENASVPALLARVDTVWTMTSLLGFEALLRGVSVTCLGMPFYAGWGLTHDQGQSCDRRVAQPELAGLLHSALIEYPLYLDPVSKVAISPEGLVARLKLRQNRRGPRLRIIAKLQGRLARFAHLWR